MCYLCAASRPSDPAARYDSHAAALGAASAAAQPGQLDQIADYLTDGFWQDQVDKLDNPTDEGRRSFDISVDTIITYDFGGLTQPAKKIAKAAMQAWADVSGLSFAAASSRDAANITFDDNDPEGAYNQIPDPSFRRGSIGATEINVPRQWDDDPISLNSYWFQTYLHEVGHALGLGHAGTYNIEADLSDRISPADSWQASVMSYFSQQGTPQNDGDFAYLATVMPADILAIQLLYRITPTTRAGDTTYGANSNVEGYLGRMFAAHFDFEKAGRFVDLDNPLSFTVFDTGGNDTLDFSTMRSNQWIDLNPFAASDVGGIRGSVLIAPETVIENAIGGRGRDRIMGNDVGNVLTGNRGNDRLFGDYGDDTLDGGSGDDRIDGGFGRDTARFLGGADIRVTLNFGRSDLQGTGQGRDRLVSIEHVRTGGGDDRLTGSADANRLDAGGGRDRLAGGAGDDTLLGGAGRDRLSGGQGTDRLQGQAGDDRLTGGGGIDSFVFAAGRDLVTDFTAGADRIVLFASLWGGEALSAVDIVARFARDRGADVVLNFGDGDRLTLAGLADTAGLAVLIDII